MTSVLEQSSDGMQSPGTKRLVVVLHGWGSRAESMDDVCRAVRETYTGPIAFYVPTLPHSSRLSSVRAIAIVLQILKEIDAEIETKGPFNEIILVGHSFGATLARRVYLVAIGAPDNIRLEHELRNQEREWAPAVTRIVLIAAFNRGWAVSDRLSWATATLFNLVGLIGHLIPKWAPTIFDVRLGASFIVQTRLHWLALRRQQAAASTGSGRTPILVQLIGTQDDLISPFDQVDIAVDAPSLSKTLTTPAARDYFLVETPYTEHDNATKLYGDESAKLRLDVFRLALTGDRLALAQIAADPYLLVDEVVPIDTTVDDTVFVIHGIRDDGFWTHRIAEHIRKEGANRKIAIRGWTPTYGYFPILPFLLPWIRRQKVEWFMDQYVSAFAQFPKSDFHYVGHSNGTYLVARSLRDYPALHLKNILFAGSVVRRDYDWNKLLNERRVLNFQNIVASADWVVAFFPKSVEWLRFFDLGGAGFDGFAQTGKNISEFKYVRGGHGAGIMEAHWEQIADFVVSSTPVAVKNALIVDPIGNELYATGKSRVVSLISATRVCLPLVALILGIAVPASVLFLYNEDGWRFHFKFEAARVLGLLIYGLVLRFFILRF